MISNQIIAKRYNPRADEKQEGTKERGERNPELNGKVCGGGQSKLK